MASVAKREWTHKGETKTAWVVRYTDQGGKRRMKTFEKKKDADKFRNQVETEVEKGEHVVATKDTTVKAVADAFIKHVELRKKINEVSEGWLMIVRNMVIVHLIPMFGVRQFSTLGIADIERMHRYLLERQAPVTAKQNMMILGQIERFALRRKLTSRTVVKDYVADVRWPPVRTIRTFTIDDVRHILKVSEVRRKFAGSRGQLFTQCMVEIATLCGLRWGEIQGLTTKNIDFDAGVILVRYSLTKWDTLKGPKTSSGVRDVPMPQRVACLIKRWMEQFYIDNDRDLIFRTRSGSAYYSSHFHIWNWRPLLKDAGLAATKDGGFHHFHALRHFAASMMIEAGLSITDVASMMGHRKFDMTLQVYAHPIVGGNRRTDAVERIASTLALPA